MKKLAPLILLVLVGCTRVESGAVMVRGDYTVVHADAETSGTITVNASRTNPPSVWAAIFNLITNLWK